MKKKRLITQLFPSYLIITLLSLFAVSWYALSYSRDFYLQRTQVNLEVSGRILEKQLLRLISPLDAAALDRLCKDAAGETDVRVTVILPDGRVVGDSEEAPARMDSHLDRIEIREAFQRRIGVSIRHSDTLDKDMMYVAMPLVHDGTLVGVLRTSIPVTAIDERISTIRLRIVFGAVLVALLASGISWFVSRRITKPIEQMRAGAERFADGDLEHRLPSSGTLEFSALADAMNRMAQQLQQHLDEITRQRRHTESILASMREGVISTDMDQRIISLNPAAAKIFGVSVGATVGRSILELLRNHEFQSLIDHCLSTGESLESDIVSHLGTERTLNIHAAPLVDPLHKRLGLLVVISDVTQLRRLENMRRDFAASVSHEIKTPLTAIKGFVETLCTSELSEPEETRRFLDIINRHVNRLTTIIEDLMKLSRIEQEDDIQQIGREACRIEAVLETAVGLSAQMIREKAIDVQVTCQADLGGCFDATLLEQAAVNLLDNAIKYSPEGSTVRIDARRSNGEIQIEFRDEGIGIARKHLPRLFERFYRVDKARIVKHIAQAHGGSVSVESELEKGSMFTLHLPLCE